jgi:hypothetical protein
MPCIMHYLGIKIILPLILGTENLQSNMEVRRRKRRYSTVLYLSLDNAAGLTRNYPALRTG